MDSFMGIYPSLSISIEWIRVYGVLRNHDENTSTSHIIGVNTRFGELQASSQRLTLLAYNAMARQIAPVDAHNPRVPT
jgi:hypothetical protein